MIWKCKKVLDTELPEKILSPAEVKELADNILEFVCVKDGMFEWRANLWHDAVDKFGDAVIITAHLILQKQVKQKNGLDYLQVFEVDGQRLWFIDDVTHVTCLLPSDY